MKSKNIWKIYFSPTGTTEKVVFCMALHLKLQLSDVYCVKEKEFDFTLKSARDGFPQLSSEDLVIFGCPTYAGRLPNLLLPYLNTIDGNGADVIAAVTFGNRNFDNSLIELRDLLTDRGFHVRAAAALACEHSFSYTLGAGRPDEEDKAEMRSFVESFIAAYTRSSVAAPLNVPGVSAENNHGGYYQPRDRHGNSIDIRKVKPLTHIDRCTGCVICVQVCPMGSIDSADVSVVSGICIKCGACIKKCPAAAKYYDDPGYLYHKKELEEMYARRASNSFFI